MFDFLRQHPFTPNDSEKPVRAQSLSDTRESQWWWPSLCFTAHGVGCVVWALERRCDGAQPGPGAKHSLQSSAERGEWGPCYDRVSQGGTGAQEPTFVWTVGCDQIRVLTE